MQRILSKRWFWYAIGIFAAILVYYIWFKPYSQGSNQPGAIARADGTVGTGLVSQVVQRGKGMAISNPLPGSATPGVGTNFGLVSTPYSGQSSLFSAQ